MLNSIGMSIITSVLLLFYIYRLRSSKNYLMLLPVFYMFICLWVLLGLSNNSISQELWLINFDHMFKTYLIFFNASIAFYLGISLVKDKQPTTYYDLKIINNVLSSIKDSHIITLYIITLLLFHIAYPLDAIYFREGYASIYDSEGGNGVKIIFDLLVNILAVLLPFHKSKIIRSILFILLLLLIQGLNKRMIVLIPILYFIGLYLRDLKFSYYKFITLVSMAFFFSIIAFSYRNNIDQGVIYNIVYFINNGIETENVIRSIDYLFGYSFIATLITANFFDIDYNGILVSITPLPSGYINIDTLLTDQKISRFAPYSALGTLGIIGHIYIFIYYLIAGLIFSYCKANFPKRYSVASIVILLFLVSFTIFSTQYQLRGATRLLYYTFLFYIIFKFCSIISYNIGKYR